ncbi:MAG: hypothetical protein IKE69_05425 [Thermoguttaceae bacterium]|nr:hypothetical protein [Thermoguttaceae bacterium]
MNLLKTDEAGNPTELVTPIVTMRRRTPDVRVDLIAAVHFAERDYYETLNRRFARYEVVLVEMIAPKGTTLAQIAGSAGKKAGKISRIGFLETIQRGMGKALGLVNQLDAIDYSAGNMVLADMDAETLFERIRENGELGGLIGETLRSLWKENEETPEDEETAVSDLSLTEFLLFRDKRRLLKRAFAVEIARGQTEGKPLFEESLIRERNTVLLDKLRLQVEKGSKYIGVFYGATHIPDIQRRLEEAGYRATAVEEITAWRL